MFISPNSKYKKIQKIFTKYETSNMTPNIKIHWKEAKGFFLKDIYGKKFIDFTSGIFTSAIGYNNKYFEKQITKALKSGFYHSYNYYNSYREKYISKLIKFVNSPKIEKCFLLSSGTEATEAAMKFARTYGSTINKNKKGIICISGNWHGRTVGSALLSGNNKQTKWIGYTDKKINHLDWPYPWLNIKDNKKFFYNSIKKIFGKNYNFKKNTCLFMLETFQGWGAIFYPKNYIKEVEKFCKKNNIVLCFDEIQAGFGRTGKKFGFEHYGVNPDLICCGKGMGSGFPLSGVLGSKKIIENKNVSGMSSTHSGNPISCAAGIATIDIIKKNNLISNSRKLGDILHVNLNKMKNLNKNLIKETQGHGLIGAIIFKDYKKYPSKKIADIFSQLCTDKGLLICNTGRESVKLGPPLIINKKGLLKSINILFECLGNLKRSI